MVNRLKEKLSPFHITILIFMIQSGVMVFSLPQQLAFHFGTNGWVALIIISGVVTLNIALFAIVHRISRGRSVFTIMEPTPKLLLYPIYLFILIAWALTGCLLVKQYVLIFQMIAFPSSHPMLFKLVIDVLIFFLLIKGIYNISKAATIFFWLIIWTVLFHFYFIPDFQWVRLTPFVFKGVDITLVGWMTVYSSFLGYELCLLLFPYSDPKSKLMRSVFLGNGFTTISYLILSIICFGFFSLDQLKSLRYPLVEIFSYVQLPVVQAVNSLVFSFFLLSIILTTVMYCWSAKEIGHRLFRINDKLLSFLIVTATYLISFIPQDLTKLKTWLSYLLYIDAGIAFGLPMILIILLLLSGKGGKTVSE